MKSPIARAFYAIYTICIFMPIFLIASIITALTTTIGCAIGNGHFWGYYPGKCWSWLTIRILFLPVRVEGREHLQPGQSYVFVSNHQGAFDIFLIYGFLGRNFKWMMKKGIRKIPLVGTACAYAHHIFVDKSGASKIKKTYDTARETLREGMSLVVFPEGARSFTGHMGKFRRTSASRLSANHQRYFQRHAAYSRLAVSVMASIESNHSRTNIPKRKRPRIRETNYSRSLRYCYVLSYSRISRLCREP